MTVQENLEIGSYVPKAKADRARSLEVVYGIFPRLAERRKQLAGTMSGGEQQMLAVGRGLMLKPRLLMLDEPSLGLAPVMSDVTFEKIGEIHKMGTAILLVEQNVSRALSLVQRAYVLESGNVIMHGTSERARQQQAGAGGVSGDLIRHCERRSSGWAKARSAVPNASCSLPREKWWVSRLTLNPPYDPLALTHHRPLRFDDLEHPWKLIHQPHQLAELHRVAGERYLSRGHRLRESSSASRSPRRAARAPA